MRFGGGLRSSCRYSSRAVELDREGTVLVVKREKIAEMYEHARETYPYECCGILVGKVTNRKEVIEVCRATNVNQGRAGDRYEIDPEELHRVDRMARGGNREIIGFYHSHPDHPPRPSSFDVERSWPGYSYLIVSITKGTDVSAKSWVWNGERREFEEEPLEEVA